MGNVLSVLYLLCYLLAGWRLARRALPQSGPAHTVPLGCAFGVALLAMLPAAAGLALGFRLPAALAGLGLALLAGALAGRGLPASRHGRRLRAGKQPDPEAWGKRGKSAGKAVWTADRADLAAMLAVCLPGILLTVWLLHTHVLRYDAATGAYYTGQSGYGDVAMHLAFIKSIAVQGKMPPSYPLLAGQELFGYPFLCESVSSVFLLLGADLKFAYILPEVPALVSIFCFVWLLARQIFEERGRVRGGGAAEGPAGLSTEGPVCEANAAQSGMRGKVGGGDAAEGPAGLSTEGPVCEANAAQSGMRGKVRGGGAAEGPAGLATEGPVCEANAARFGMRGKATLATLLFFLGGGFGFAYFLGSREAFRSIFTGYYTTPTNYVEKNIRWVNCIADLLVPQRATLMGWALMLPCLYLLYRFAFEQEKRLWLPLGLLAGCLPLMQTHSLLALVLMSAVYLVRPLAQAVKARSMERLWPWLGYAAVAGILCLPQLLGIIFRQTGQGSGFLQLLFNWVNNGTGENYFWFYIKNLGLIYLIQIPAYFWAKRPLRRFYLGGLAVLAVSEFIVFQPNSYDNIKLLFFWFLCACLLAANALWDWLALLPGAALPQKLARGGLAVLVLAACTLSGLLTLGRELVSNYQVFSAESMALAEYVDENTPADALFLTGQQHLNPVASLAGRNILCGSTLYVHFHGMDYYAQQEAVRRLYENPSEALLEEWGVDYVLFSGCERSDYAADEVWYAARYEAVCQYGEYVLYRVGPPAEE